MCDQNQMSEELLEQFWDLSKNSYKKEVYKIINDISYLLK